jgi:hypothetical protein
MLVTAFVIIGAGILWFVLATSAASRSECERQCSAQGKRSVAAPTGTTGGRSVDGTRYSTDPPDQCTCVSTQ